MLRLGLLVDDTIKQHTLTQLVEQAGWQVAVSLIGNGTGTALPDEELDAWLVDLTGTAAETAAGGGETHPASSVLDDLLAQTRMPVLLSDSSEYPVGSPEHLAWLGRIRRRLQRLNGDINLQQETPASELWLLAASTGGPAAVKRFLAQLPADLGIAFLYVQHIDAQQTVTLNRMMTNAGHYPAQAATQGHVLAANSLTLITARDAVEILDNGTLMVKNGQPWKGCYAPSIDQVAANAARIYRARCNLIVFTGMGDDGAASCRLIKQVGGRVWVQSPDDCASDSMPVSALATGCVSLMGTPEYLAQALVNSYLPAARPAV